MTLAPDSTRVNSESLWREGPREEPIGRGGVKWASGDEASRANDGVS